MASYSDSWLVCWLVSYTVIQEVRQLVGCLVELSVSRSVGQFSILNSISCNDTGALFHTTDAMAFSNARFGQGSDAILLDNVACTGTEERLINCPYDSHTGDCFHSEDAGLRCPIISRMSGFQDISRLAIPDIIL